MTDIASLQIKVDSTQTEKAAKSLDSLTTASDKADKSSQKLANSWSNEQKLINQRAASILEIEKQSDMAADKAWALANGYTQVGDSIVKAGNDSTTSMKSLGLHTKESREKLIMLGKEAITGDFSRMPRTFASLVTSSQLLPALISPIGVAIGVATAAAIAGGYAWSKWGEDAKKALKEAETGLEKITAKAAAAQRLTQVQELDKLEREIKSADLQARIQSELGRDENNTREIRAIAYRASGQFRSLAEGLRKQKSDLEDQMRKETDSDKEYDVNEKTISKMKREADIYGYTAGQIQIYDSARAGANDRQIEEIIILSQAMDKRKEDAQLQEDIAKRQTEINKQYADDTAKANKKAAEESEKAWATFADQTQRVLGDVLYNGMVGKFQNIEEMFKEMILRMIANAAAAQAMMSLTSGAKSMMPSLLGAFTGGGQNYGSAGISEADWLSGARADGGPVTGGSSYLVGERGPEIFTPTTSGQITANGGGGVTITDNTVINIDSRSDRMQVMNDVNRMIEQGNSRLVDRLQRQGQLA